MFLKLVLRTVLCWLCFSLLVFLAELLWELIPPSSTPHKMKCRSRCIKFLSSFMPSLNTVEHKSNSSFKCSFSFRGDLATITFCRAIFHCYSRQGAGLFWVFNTQTRGQICVICVLCFAAPVCFVYCSYAKLGLLTVETVSHWLISDLALEGYLDLVIIPNSLLPLDETSMDWSSSVIFAPPALQSEKTSTKVSKNVELWAGPGPFEI